MYMHVPVPDWLYISTAVLEQSCTSTKVCI